MTEMYSAMDYQNDFEKYAIKHLGVSAAQFHDWRNIQNQMYSNVMTYAPTNYLTPYILEERELRATQMDIFSRLMMDRILYLAGPINDQMSTIVQAQLLWLNNIDSGDITFHIDSPGGSVKSGLSIIDAFDLSRADIKTVNTGMCASMASVILGAGTKGKRSALKRSKVMMHQVSTGMSGNIQDLNISISEGNKENLRLFDMLGEYCGKPAQVVLQDATRDNWLEADEALEYGIIDEIVKRKVD